MRLLATRRFVLRCAKYVSGPVLASSSDNKVTVHPNLASSSNGTVLLALFNAVDGRYLTSSSLDVDNISVFGRLLTDAELSKTANEMFGTFVNNADSGTSTVAMTNASEGHPDFDVVVRQWDNYGLNLNKVGNPVLSGLVQLNGHNRFSERDGNYLNYVQPWQHHKCTPADGINMYSFALHPEDHQPSGTCNMSRIDNTTLSLTFDHAVSSGDNKISIYAVNYNVLRILSGMGGLAYSN